MRRFTGPTATHAWSLGQRRWLRPSNEAPLFSGSANEEYPRRPPPAPSASRGTGAELSTGFTTRRGQCVTVSADARGRTERFFGAQEAAPEPAVGETQKKTEHGALLTQAIFRPSSSTGHTRAPARWCRASGPGMANECKQDYDLGHRTRLSRLTSAAVARAKQTERKKGVAPQWWRSCHRETSSVRRARLGHWSVRFPDVDSSRRYPKPVRFLRGRVTPPPRASRAQTIVSHPSREAKEPRGTGEGRERETNEGGGEELGRPVRRWYAARPVEWCPCC